MAVKVKLFATLRQERFDEQDIDYVANITVQNVIQNFNIPQQDVAIIFINGKHANLDQELNDGDTLSLFPPIGGG